MYLWMEAFVSSRAFCQPFETELSLGGRKCAGARLSISVWAFINVAIKNHVLSVRVYHALESGFFPMIALISIPKYVGSYPKSPNFGDT